MCRLPVLAPIGPARLRGPWSVGAQLIPGPPPREPRLFERLSNGIEDLAAGPAPYSGMGARHAVSGRGTGQAYPRGMIDYGRRPPEGGPAGRIALQFVLNYEGGEAWCCTAMRPPRPSSRIVGAQRQGRAQRQHGIGLVAPAPAWRLWRLFTGAACRSPSTASPWRWRATPRRSRPCASGLGDRQPRPALDRLPVRRHRDRARLAGSVRIHAETTGERRSAGTPGAAAPTPWAWSPRRAASTRRFLRRRPALLGRGRGRRLLSCPTR